MMTSPSHYDSSGNHFGVPLPEESTKMDFANSTFEMAENLTEVFPPPPPSLNMGEANNSSSAWPREKMSASLKGCSLGQFGAFLLHQLLEVLPLRSKPMGVRDVSALFPLPTSRSVLIGVLGELSSDVMSWMLCLCLSLNSVWGDELHCDREPNQGQAQCLQMLREEALRLCAIDSKMEPVNWTDFFKIRGVDCRGDEVRVARRFQWENIQSALPREIGAVELRDVCSDGSRFYVDNFDLFLKPPEEWGEIPSPKVMVSDEHWPAVCRGLVKAGVCVFLREDEVFRAGSNLLLNGLFGVPKDETDDDGFEVQEYERINMPRNIKKSVQRSTRCEMQGALVDGVAGFACPREAKLAKYLYLAFMLSQQPTATQKEWQVVCGGLVYFAMFRRPLLGSLNKVWTHIESFTSSCHHRLPVPEDCKLEILRFIGLVPLARLDFRLDMDEEVTFSDASTTGGGVCVSKSLTQLGAAVAQGSLRGEHPATATGERVLSIGLFDGIGALRVALELQGVNVIGHVSVEPQQAAARVVEANWPGSVHVSTVEEVDYEMVVGWSLQFSQATVVVLGSGPPCQGVSGLNSDRRGALGDLRSSLFSHVPRIRSLVQHAFPWCVVHSLMESVGSMDTHDRDTMSSAFGCEPILADAGQMSWCRRPRLYWLSWSLSEGCGATCTRHQDHPDEWFLEADQDLKEVLSPGRKPAGIRQCSDAEILRWQTDAHRFPPYQYKDQHCVQNRQGELRVPNVSERELLLGFPLHYTASCLPKGERKGATWNDCRLTLLGNSWSVPVVAWLINQLFSVLGICPLKSPQDIMNEIRPGSAATVQGRLLRLPLTRSQPCTDDPWKLARKLGNLVSLKGEDLMLQASQSQQAKFQRLRASVPSKLWNWRIVTGWQWRSQDEHINALELRAILTAIRWRLEHKRHFARRFLHLTDSLVCGVGESAPVVGMGKRLLEATEPEERAKQRQRLGTLRSLTVQPATRRRYDLALQGFLTYLRQEGLVLPTNKLHVDSLVSDFLEVLWSSGKGRGLACDTLAALQGKQPNVKGHLQGSWRLLKAWHTHEIPNRAPPLPEHLVQAMSGWAIFKGHNSFATSLLVGFYGMLRTGELLQVRASHLNVSTRERQALLSLGFTKTGQRHGAAESVVLGRPFSRVLPVGLPWADVVPALRKAGITKWGRQ
eukprot:Skav202536  [mRNA]  locus=scaffold2011:198967:205206:- [translate_table: standard]